MNLLFKIPIVKNTPRREKIFFCIVCVICVIKNTKESY